MEHFKKPEIIVSKIKKTKKYIELVPSNIHCFNKIMNDWLDIKTNDQLEVFEKELHYVVIRSQESSILIP